MNATTKSLLRVGNYKFSLSPEFPSWSSVSVRKRVICNGRRQRLKICSVGKDVEINNKKNVLLWHSCPTLAERRTSNS